VPIGVQESHELKIKKFAHTKVLKITRKNKKMFFYSLYGMTAKTGPIFDLDKCYGYGWCIGHCPKEEISIVKRDTKKLTCKGHKTIKDWASDERDS
jgi:Pyruvate/2-oxoacid:ferredoxin oxidoreductase delta subunit